MATPLTGLQHRDGGGISAIMAGPVNPLDPSPAKTCLNSSALKSPILIFLYFHKAIRSELDGLHRAAIAFATHQESDIKPLLERYHFLRAIYKHHCNAEDVVSPSSCFQFSWNCLKLRSLELHYCTFLLFRFCAFFLLLSDYVFVSIYMCACV